MLKIPMRLDSVIGQVAQAARRRRPLFHVTVSPRLARFLIAAGAQPAVPQTHIAKNPAVHGQEAAGRGSTTASKLSTWLDKLAEHTRRQFDEGFESGVLVSGEYDQGRSGPVQTTDPAGIVSLHPRTYTEARTIGERLREGTPVLLNLTETADSDAKRIVDFSAGLIFALRGSIERVTNKVFLLSPPHTELTSDARDRITETTERGSFDQRSPAARTDLFGQITIYTLLEDRVADFDRLVERVVQDVRANEPDTLVYVVRALPSAPIQRILYEVYRTRQAYERHGRQPYVVKFEADRRPYVLVMNVIELGLRQANASPFPSVTELFPEPGYDTSGFERPDYLRDYGREAAGP